MIRCRIVSVAVVALLVPGLRAEPPAEEGRVADFVKALTSDNAAVRKQVALALGDMGEKAKSAVPALRELLLDSDKEVQAAAAKALGQIGGARAEGDERRVGELTAEVRKLKDRLEAAQADAAAQARALQDAQADQKRALKEAQDALAKQLAQAADARKLFDARTEEVKQLRDRLLEAETKGREQAAQADKQRAQLVNAQAEAELLKKRSEALEERVRELEKALEKAKSEKTPEPPPPAKNPPAENVEGMVTRIDENSGLLTISIGSDAGVQKGQTLEVFRLKPAPKYLGAIRVIDVRPNEAVGTFVAKPTEPAKQGDHVASKILEK